jgi:predicted Zn finger-like uncharacterized protein
MLLTTCPNCNAQFKVAPELLNVRQGRVMCGRCRHPFNAFESLRRVDDDAMPTFETAGNDGEDTTPPTLNETFDTFEEAAQKLERLAAAEVISEPAASPFDLDLTAVSTVGQRIGDDSNRAAAHPLSPAPASATAEDMRAAMFTTVTTTTTASIDELNSVANATEATASSSPSPSIYSSNTNNPLLTGDVPHDRRPSRAWPWLAVLAALGLVAQMAYYFRGDIIERYPEARPHFVKACETLGCNIGWRRDETQFSFTDSTLFETPGKPGQYLVTAILHNRAPFKQDYPHMEVRLTDTSNTLLTSRVLAPAEYLGRAPRGEEGIAAHTDLYINLRIELTGKAASGYGLRPLFP